MSRSHTTHQFALFIEQPFIDNTIVINDPVLYHRIIRVLKCTVGSTIQLFNNQYHTQAELFTYSKKECFFRVGTIVQNPIFKPQITLGLPLLKGNDLEEAISFATQIGVSAIQLLQTEYVQRPFKFANEEKRLIRIVIAATEQSKRFAMPIIKEPIPFASIKNVYQKDVILFGTQDGMHITTLLNQSYIKDITNSFLFIVGPEADFSDNEYTLLKEWHAQPICLSPAVLRSCTAAGMGVGLLRALTSCL
ncbi:16S rRNA (uracil(1498)-N(3))-methyltransferase [Candidatus Dependentiae bacterium]|nr:MAG: 16S rRNA (uracil(1498)-N(3))-methyltransferase [Candidatus Dependentiae bacterium]